MENATNLARGCAYTRADGSIVSILLRATQSMGVVASDKRHDSYGKLAASILATVLGKGKPAAKRGCKAMSLVF